jgi:hypothetical protein
LSRVAKREERRDRGDGLVVGVRREVQDARHDRRWWQGENEEEQTILERRPVPESAFDYPRRRAWLSRGLQRELERELTPERWEVWTLADPATPAARLARFAEGGALATDDLEAAITREVSHAPALAPTAVWLVPDPMARLGDPFPEKAATGTGLCPAHL